MNGGGQYVVFFVPAAAKAKVSRWTSLLRQRLISMLISVAISCAIWYFFAEQVGAFGPWMVGLAAVGGLGWVVYALIGWLLARRETTGVGEGPAFAVTHEGAWLAGLWLAWPEVGGVRATPGRLGRSAHLVLQGRDGRAATVPMEFLSALPASIDSAVRALSGGRSWIDLSRLDD